MATPEAASLRWLAFFARASDELAGSIDDDATFDRIVALAVPELSDVCALELLEDDGHLVGAALAHVDPDAVQLLRAVLGRTVISSRELGPRRLALATGRAQLINVRPGYWASVAADAEHEQQLEALGLTSLVAVPLQVRDRALGVVTLAFTHASGRRFSEVDLPVIEDLARRAALAVDNARLYRAQREALAQSTAARARLTVLAEASRVLAGSLDFEATLHNVAGVIVPAVADHVAVDLVEADGRIRRVVSVARAEQAAIAKGLLRFPPAAEDRAHFVVKVLTGGQPFFVAKIEVGPKPTGITHEEHVDLITRLGVTSTVLAPMAGHEGIIGVLTASTTVASGRHFTTDDAALIEDLAQRAAVAVEHARLFASQRDVALTLQRSLLPAALPDIPGMTSACRYVPAAPDIEVGGDWYDVIPMPGGRVLAAMGDVEGRGVPAAARMGQLRNAMLAYAAEGRSPARILTGLDRLLSNHGPRGLATLALVMIDPETGTARIANAGHPPPLHAHSDGTVTFVEGGLSAPLGALSRTHYHEYEWQLDPGSTIVLFTDGVFEDRTESADVGLERLRLAMYATQGAPVAEVVDEVLRAGQRDRSPGDDAAILAVRFDALGPELRLQLVADANVLAPLRATLRRWLKEVGVADVRQEDIVLAAGEACANAIEHAYGPGPATFDLRASISDDGEVCVTVRDRGSWRRPRADESRGRGRLVMEAFSDELTMLTGEDGTEVCLRWGVVSGDAGQGGH
jgi:serine phosphatase RsbU (regulator of sigma subunit)/anti-sigma regulatory factor (Ser/Thr protein kinase)